MLLHAPAPRPAAQDEGAVPLVDEGTPEGLREVTLAAPGRAEKDRVLALAEEATGSELEDEAAIHLLVEVEVVAVERLVGVAEVRLFEAAGEEPVGAAGELVLDEEREEVRGREVIGLGLDEPRLETLGHAAEGRVGGACGGVQGAASSSSPSVGARPCRRSR